MRRLALITLLGLLAIGGVSGCSNNPTSTSMGTMNIVMTDAPGDFQSVNLVVHQVAVKRDTRSGSSDSDWEVLSSQSRTIDLLQLRNGVFATLGLAPLPAGRYDGLRLKLGSGSNVVVAGVAHPLRVTSDQQRGVILVGSFVVPKSGQVDVGLDFDVARSIHANQDGSFTLRHKIRCVCVNIPDRTPGSIRGSVLPSDALASVYLMSSADTVASTMADGQGNFQMGMLSAGTYSLTFHSTHGYQDATMGNVVVSWGQATNVGTTQLTPTAPPPPPPPPTMGTVSGLVSPVVAASVTVMQGTSVAETLSVDLEGRFLAVDLPPGSYDVQIHPLAGFQDASRTGVSVTAGVNTDLGTIILVALGPPPPPPPGAIVGHISPAGFPTTVSVMQNGLVVASMDALSDGSFSFPGLAPGTYDVHVHPAFDFRDSDIMGVVVTSGQTTDIGQVVLQP